LPRRCDNCGGDRIIYGLPIHYTFLLLVADILTRVNLIGIGNQRCPLSSPDSLIASAERHRIDPQRYLTGLFARLPFTRECEIYKFLADVWKAESERHVVP
jgi:hypothetical protein